MQENSGAMLAAGLARRFIERQQQRGGRFGGSDQHWPLHRRPSAVGLPDPRDLLVCTGDRAGRFRCPGARLRRAGAQQGSASGARRPRAGLRSIPVWRHDRLAVVRCARRLFRPEVAGGRRCSCVCAGVAGNEPGRQRLGSRDPALRDRPRPRRRPAQYQCPDQRIFTAAPPDPVDHVDVHDRVARVCHRRLGRSQADPGLWLAGHFHNRRLPSARPLPPS